MNEPSVLEQSVSVFRTTVQKPTLPDAAHLIRLDHTRLVPQAGLVGCTTYDEPSCILTVVSDVFWEILIISYFG